MNPNRCRIWSAVVASLLVGAVSAGTAVINGDFEAGNLGAWDTTGDTSVQTASIGVAPTGGRFMAMLTTLCDHNGSTACETANNRELPISGRNAVHASDQLMMNFFGFKRADLSPLFTGPDQHQAPRGDGSGIKQTITAQRGARLSFDFYFATAESGVEADIGFFALIPTGGGRGSLVVLNRPGGTTMPSPIDLCTHVELGAGGSCGLQGQSATGWRQYSTVIPEDGEYTIGFGVWEAAEGQIPSALLVDNLRIEPPGS